MCVVRHGIGGDVTGRLGRLHACTNGDVPLLVRTCNVPERTLQSYSTHMSGRRLNVRVASCRAVRSGTPPVLVPLYTSPTRSRLSLVSIAIMIAIRDASRGGVFHFVTTVPCGGTRGRETRGETAGGGGVTDGCRFVGLCTVVQHSRVAST